jgi:DnaJ-class molecular chaperone
VLNEQKFVVIHAHVSQLQLEAARIQELHPVNNDCPECKGKGEVPQHGGLRQKTCPRCNGRGWVKAPLGT